MGAPGAVTFGAGILYTAALGSAEPTDLTAAWPAAWRQLGYTDEGSEFSYQLNTENIEVAEEFDPIKIVSTGRALSVAFALAEITLANLEVAFNGGTSTTTAGVVDYAPPAIGNEGRRMIGWEADDDEERWIFRQCIQSGTIGVGRRKAPGKATLPCELRLEKPTNNSAPFRVLIAAVRT